eukprot:gene196-260_t
MQKMKRVVVTGLGALTPIGNTTQTYWDNLVAGTSGAAPITRFDATKHKTKFACELKGYREEDYFDRKEAKKLDLCSQYALISTAEAIQDAAFAVEGLDLERVGVVWGTGIGGIQTIEEEITAYVQADMSPKFTPFFVPKMIANMPAGHISIKYGFKGPNYVAVSACASAANALISAVNFIQLGFSDVMITGGSEAAVNPVALGGFNVIKALSSRNDDPTTASRPFDKDRDGFVLGEGAGTLILESYEHAVARGAKIYAEVLGVGLSGEAYHITAPHPDGQGAALVMKNALKNAGIQPQEVDYINVHGTSTPLGDVSEVKAIQQIFQEHAYQLNISSTKSMTGHLLGAAGAIESIAAILAMKYSVIPPTINHFELDDAIDNKLNFTFNKAQNRPVSVALNNSFGFGGHNTSKDLKTRQLKEDVYAITTLHPNNLSLYRLALQHSSAKIEQNSNERLEFLGDAVLSLVVAEYLFKKYPLQEEGFLTEIRSRIVNRASLGELAKKIGMDELLRYDTRSVNQHNTRFVYGNALEAFIGAVYLDQGYMLCAKFIVESLLKIHIDLEAIVVTDHNYKKACTGNAGICDTTLIGR